MRNQTKFTFQIGYDLHNHAGAMIASFQHSCVEAASKLCGGCTSSIKTGWWMEDGAEHKQTFEGRMCREECFQIELTCEEHKAEDALSKLMFEIAEAALVLDIETDWVHVTETPMTGRHFSVKKLQETMLTDA